MSARRGNEARQPQERSSLSGESSGSAASTPEEDPFAGQIVARPYQWETYDGQGESDTLQILLWCLGRNSEKILLRIEDFPATFMIELPFFVEQERFHWDADTAMLVVETLQTRLKKDGHAPVNPSPADFWDGWDKLYHYQLERKFPHIMVKFKTEEAMKHAKNILRWPIEVHGVGMAKFNVWEPEIPTTTKLITQTKINHSSWIRVQAKHVEDPVERISVWEQEYIAQWSTIYKIPEKVSGGWRNYPTVMVYDIEQYSDKKLQFPDKYNPRHHVYLNCLSFQRLDEPDSARRRYGILYGDCEEVPPERMANLKLIKVKEETDVQKEMARLMRKHDPQLISGYNTLAYDNVVLDARMEIHMEDWPQMGCLKGKMGYLMKSNWSSSGAGFNSINKFFCPGRINLDMLHVVKKDGHRLREYGLNAVAYHFLEKEKHDMPAWRMFEIYEGMRKAMALTVAEDQGLDPKETVRLGTSDLKGSKRGGSRRRAVKRTDKRARKLARALADMTDVLLYCINDSELVFDLIVVLNVWIGANEMSNATAVSIEDFYTKGQQHRCMNKLYKKAKGRNIVLDTKVTTDIPYQGGAVCDPVPGFHPYVIVQDFESLYPSIMNAYNLCYTTLVPAALVKHIDPKDLLHLHIDCDEMMRLSEEAKGKKRRASGKAPVARAGAKPPPKSYGFMDLYFYQGKRGVMPDLVKEMIEKRRKVKGLMGAAARAVKTKEQEIKETEKSAGVLLEEAKVQFKDLDAETLTRVVSYLGGEGPILEFPLEENQGTYQVGTLKDLIETTKGKIDKAKAGGVTEEELAELKKDLFFLNVERDRLDKKQLGIKIFTNSCYGFTAARNGGKRTLVELAMATTFLGRTAIGRCNTYLKETYGAQIAYGDTDSTMIIMPKELVNSNAECKAWGDRLSKELTALFPPGLNMTHEKDIRAIFIKKKNYIYMHLKGENDVLRNLEGVPIIEAKGVLSARRDNATWACGIYDKAAMSALMREPMANVVNVLFDGCQQILSGGVPMDELVVTKTMNANYTSKTATMKVFGDELRRLGRPAQPGDRLSYVIVKTPNPKEKMGKKMMLREMFVELQDTENPPELDYPYYIQKMLKTHFDNLFRLAYAEEIAYMEDVKFRPNKRCKFTNLNDIVFMIGRRIDAGRDLEKLRAKILRRLDDYEDWKICQEMGMELCD